MEDPIGTVMEVLSNAASAYDAIRNPASAQLLAYFKEPGFAGVLVVRHLFGFSPIVYSCERCIREINERCPFPRVQNLSTPSNVLPSIAFMCALGNHCQKERDRLGSAVASCALLESSNRAILCASYRARVRE